MNKYQRIVFIVAAIDIALMMLFPPFLDNPLRRGTLPGLEGYYFLPAVYEVKRIHSQLLTLQILFVLINALIAWLVLDQPAAAGRQPTFRYTRAIVLFLAGNFVLLFAFPPYESYSLLARFEAPGFDGFHFVLGDKRNRNFFIPLLYLEITLVVVNALAVWLLFNRLLRGEVFARETILELAQALPPEQLAEVSKTLGYRAVHAADTEEAEQHETQMGSGPDRRRHPDPRYRGPERRKGGDRRYRMRTA